ncbi:Drug resistance protein [Termitomyces sp. T112]|nr:Drug resistance protein [Termitomyces sp. T112]
MIVLLFPNRVEQDRALSLFAGFGAVGNMGGLVIGGIISERIGWRWCFWIMAMAILPICLATFFLSPSPASTRSKSDVYKNMDWVGLFLMTAAVLLLVFAVTEGNVKGWASKEVLPPLIISLLLFPVFGYVETIAKEPLIPPWIWTLPTFTPLFFIVLSEYAYMNTLVLQSSEVFQRVWNVSAVNAAIRIIPFGLTGLITTFIVGTLTPYVSPRFLLCGGHALVLAGAVLLAFSGTEDTYWTKVFPAFIISCAGLATAFVSSNIAMLRAPLFSSGVDLLETTSLIGAIFNASLQIGSSVGLSIVIAISTKVSGGDVSDFKGYRAGWWFIAGLAGFEALLAAISLWRHGMPPNHLDDEKTLEKGQDSWSERPSE